MPFYFVHCDFTAHRSSQNPCFVVHLENPNDPVPETCPVCGCDHILFPAYSGGVIQGHTAGEITILFDIGRWGGQITVNVPLEGEWNEQNIPDDLYNWFVVCQVCPREIQEILRENFWYLTVREIPVGFCGVHGDACTGAICSEIDGNRCDTEELGVIDLATKEFIPAGHFSDGENGWKARLERYFEDFDYTIGEFEDFLERSIRDHTAPWDRE